MTAARLDLNDIDMVLNNMRREELGDIDGVKTGIDTLDNILGYLHNGGLYIIFGRPGIGKTEFAINLVYQNTIMNNKAVVYEMSDPSMNVDVFTRRLVRMMTGIDTFGSDGRSAREKEEIRKAARNLENKFIFMGEPLKGEVFDETEITLKKFCCDTFNRTYPDYIIIDDFEHIEFSEYPGHERWDLSMKRVASALKKLAVDMNRPVIVLAEACSDCELRADKRPMLSDLSHESLSYDFLSYEADGVISLYREDYYDPDANSDSTEINVLSNVYGHTGRVLVGMMPEFDRYVEIDDETWDNYREI